MYGIVCISVQNSKILCNSPIIALRQTRIILNDDLIHNKKLPTFPVLPALRIHMSQTARDALTALGGYDVHARGQMEIKVRL